MRKNRKLTHLCTRFYLSVLLFSAITIAARPQSAPDFSGLWIQDNDRCQPKRSGNVTLLIEHHDPELTITTSISHDSGLAACDQQYTIDEALPYRRERTRRIRHRDRTETRPFDVHRRPEAAGAFFARLRHGRSSRTAQHSRGSGSARMARSRFFSISARSARPSKLAPWRVRAVDRSWQ